MDQKHDPERARQGEGGGPDAHSVHPRRVRLQPPDHCIPRRVCPEHSKRHPGATERGRGCQRKEG